MKPIEDFIDREAEIEYLNHMYAKSGKQLAVLYGRRRVGKTELITHFCKHKKSIYFLADKRGTLSNAERFASICADYFKDIRPDVKNFDEVFLYIKNRINKERIIIVIDEFSYLVEKDESIPSVFQLIFDEVLKETNVVLVLSGSSISMMFKGVLSYKSPLYGRRTGEWMLKSMSFRDIRKFYPDLSIEEMVNVYAVVGGIPAYSAHFDDKDIFESIKSSILKKGEYLYNEPEVLLKEELRDPSSYFSILEAMTSSSKLTEIANAARIPAKDMPKYLKVLENLEIVFRIIPVTEKKSKKSLYLIKDNFFNFWFRFVYPRKSELESGHSQEVLAIIKRDFNSYIGRIFEQICREYIEQEKICTFSKIGKWWGYSKNQTTPGRKSEEIDIVTIDENSKVILFAECKWQEKQPTIADLEKLRAKASFVDWEKNKRTEKFAFFSKSGFDKKTREYSQANGWLLVDLVELEKAFKNK